jgi:DNA-binding response OmpR family regulator
MTKVLTHRKDMEKPVDDLKKDEKVKAARRRKRAFRVLLVDNDPRCREAFSQLAVQQRTHQVTLLTAGSVAEARRCLHNEPVDLLVVEPTISNNHGLELATEVAAGDNPVQAIVMASSATYNTALAAIRAGASDVISKPLNVAELSERVSQAIDRTEAEHRKADRVRRLRRICKKLNAARNEVTQQVDILCSDLVTAYQELADQMHNVVETSEYAALLRRELDLERLLHQTLEFILEKAGATNAAIFLPVTVDEYTLGGYVNYDCADGSPEILLNHLADVVAPRVAEHDTHVHLTDNDAIHDWVGGDDSTYLTDCHMLAVPCYAENEPLAVMTLFRDSAQPFGEDVINTCNAIAPMLGQYLAKIVRVHHRHMHD